MKSDKDLSLKLDIARKANIDDRETAYYGGLAMNLFDTLGNPHGKTACTDGARIYWDRDFLDSLTHEELRAVQIHETMHPSHGHLWRFKMNKLANIACDYVINGVIASKFTHVKLPAQALLDKRFDGLCEEEVYNILRKEEEQKPGKHDKQPGQPGNGSGDPCGDYTAPADDAQAPDDAKPAAGDKSQTDPTKARQGKGKGQGEAPSGKGDDDPQPGQPGKGGQGQPAEQQGERQPAPASSRTGKPTLKEQWENAVVQQAQIQRAMAGTVPGDALQQIERVKHQRLDWRSELADFVRNTISRKADWSRMARRMATAPVIYPRFKRDDIGQIVFVRDTSGSVFSIVPQFNAVCENILAETDGSAVVLDTDTRVAGEYRVSAGEEMPETAAGGGGTDFRAVFERIDALREEGEHISGVVFLTDLETCWEPEHVDFPLLYVCTTNLSGKAGRTVKVEI